MTAVVAPVEAPPLTQWQELLNRAADVTQERGLYQGGYCADREGSVCLVGAINVACGNYADEDAVDEAAWWSALDAYLGEARPPTWNDQPGRTAAEVIAALRAASLQAQP